MLETNAIQFLPAVEFGATQTRAVDPASAGKEFEALLIETVLRHGGFLKAFEGSDGDASAMMGEMMLPLLARQLAEQMQLGMGEMMMKSITAKAGEK
jgi:hypothetical protein